MKNWTVYRCALKLLPARGKIHASDFPKEQTEAVRAILRRNRCVGATLCLFDETSVTNTLTFGVIHRPDAAATAGTVYRAASISKFAVALCAMRLAEAGRLNLDADVNGALPFPLRHPGAPDTPITLRMLLTHTAGVHDGEAYNAGVGQGVRLSDLMQKDSFTRHSPGAAWEYSNLGAGIAGAAMECVTGQDFETLMRETVFRPLNVAATYYPQNVSGDLADCYRLLPPGKAPCFDAAARRKRPLPDAKPDPETHYALAPGGLCVSAPDLTRLGMAGMMPGFLSRHSLDAMRREAAPFGERANNLAQGIGTFILREPRISRRTLYGHQGMAYGAVNGLFFDPETKKGLALLTSGASEARRGVLADLNFDLLRLFLGDQHG